MLKRILFTIAYDGSDFFGWQKQPDENIRTVQGEFEKALGRFFKKNVECIGASRTDRAIIDIDTTVPTEKFPLALHSFLPEDISVVKAEDVSEEFHPRYDCVKKIYRYKIYNGKYRNPICRKYSEYCHVFLDEKKMNEVSKAFIGTHDFKAFAASGNSSKTTVRTIFDIYVKREGEFVVITVTGDGFLYNMIRIMAGTLMLAGTGKLDFDGLLKIIESRDRTKAGKTAGPNGLTLMEINY